MHGFTSLGCLNLLNHNFFKTKNLSKTCKKWLIKEGCLVCFPHLPPHTHLQSDVFLHELVPLTYVPGWWIVPSADASKSPSGQRAEQTNHSAPRYLPSFTSVTSANWMLSCDKIEDLTTDPDAHSQEPYAESWLGQTEAYMSLLTMKRYLPSPTCTIIFLAQPEKAQLTWK